MANIVDPDQTTPTWVVWAGSALFARPLIFLRYPYSHGSAVVGWLETLGHGAEGRGIESGLGQPATGKLCLSTQQLP